MLIGGPAVKAIAALEFEEMAGNGLEANPLDAEEEAFQIYLVEG